MNAAEGDLEKFQLNTGGMRLYMPGISSQTPELLLICSRITNTDAAACTTPKSTDQHFQEYCDKGCVENHPDDICV